MHHRFEVVKCNGSRPFLVVKGYHHFVIVEKNGVDKVSINIFL